MRYNKLVRNNIPKIIEENGQKPSIHTAGNKEYFEKLKEKLREEVEEFLEQDCAAGELVDILEGIDAISGFKGFNEIEIGEIKKAKKIKNGSFDKKIILDEVED